MAAEYAVLAISSIIMFGIIGVVIGSLAAFMKTDSRDYDEQFVWLRKIKE
ncbi:hypothetical protein [Paenibacillus sp. 1011MAR3C5]|nr:hypothetical protein [Paenibacillus sp. 1011MAR3C5]